MAAINVSVGGDTRQLERDIQKTVNKSYNINLKTKGDQPLGRITGQVNEFEKSLAASNARVIAFGASAGIIFGLEKAFGALAASTVEVQKSLAEINVILNVSTSQLSKFGGELFNIAKDTGQSFAEVAKAATEFSRQGLGVEETLKRTNQALILSRLSGLDAAKSVESLTAAVNSYASQAVTASEVVNKFANVDAAFAVSSADLADALSRVGSSAAQSGVSLNELIAIVTAAQQTTARGGAVIGNSFKTIFTRLQRGKVVDLLENLGIDTMDSSGQIKSTIQLLQDLAKTYDQLGTLQQAEVAEKVGGVFQINILKAALADLGKEYSIYNSALNVAASTTDQAIRRNEELNQTYAAQINVLKENAKQLAASAGGRVLGPAFERVVGGANQVLGGINESEGSSYGSVLGKGILDGLGQIIAGPGLALLGGIFAKLFADLSKYAVGSAKDFLGLNNAAKQQAELQRSITDILSKNPALIAQMSQGTAGVNKLAETLLTTLRAQTVELQKQQQVAAQVASILSRSGVKVKDGVPMAPPTGKPGKAAGYVPNFAAGVSKKDALAETIGAYQAGYEPGAIRKKRLYDGQGGSFLATVNNAESFKTVVGPNDEKGTFVTPPNAAKGFVPNFAGPQPNIGKYIPFAESLGLKVGQVTSTDFKLVKAAILKNGGNRSQQEIENDIRQIAASRKGIKTTSGALKGAGKFAYLYASQGPQNEESGRVILNKDGSPIPYNFTSMGTKNPFTFEDDINSRLTPIINDLAKQVLPQGSKLVPVEGNDFNQFIDKSAFSQIYGRLFEAVVNRALSKSVKGESGNQRFEFFAGELAGPNGVKLQDIFDGNVGGFAAADLKFRKSPDSILSFVKKMASATGIPYDKTAKLAAQGYVPNFSALQDAVNRERAAGVSSGKIYVAQDKRLAASGYNPLGLGVFNTRDEPNSGARSRAIKSRGYSGGYIPNFVEEDTAPADLSSSVAALVTQLGFVAFALSGFGNQYKQSLNDLTRTNVEAAKANLRAARDSGVASEETRRQLSQNVRNAQKTTFGQKLGAGVTAGGSALAIGAPILAQTIANAIGQQTKEARVGSAAASAFGDIGSFAGTGALVAGPKGAIVGGLIGALTGLTGVIKELNTNLPELSSKAKQSASELTQFTEASQRTKTSFEQIQDLQSKGQNVEAGKAEQELIKNIGKDFTNNPELQAQAISAVINKDFAGLQAALDKNTIALQAKTESDNNRESIQKYFEKTRDEIGYADVEMGISSDKIYTQEDRKQIQTEFRNSLGSKIASTGNLEENRKFVNQLDTFFKKNMATAGPRGGRYDPEKLRTLSGQSRTDLLNLLEVPKDQQEQFQNLSQGDFYEQVTRPAFGETNTKRDLFTSIDRNSGKFNKEVQALLQNIGDVRGKFDNFAQSVGFSLTLQKDFNNALAAAKTAVEAAKLGNFANAATQLGDTGAARGYNMQASVLENERQRNESMNNAFSQIQGVLTQYLVAQAKKTQDAVVTTPDASANEDPLKVAQRAQGEIRASIEKLIQQLSDINFKPGESDVDPFKSIEDNLKRIFDKANVPKDQQNELAQKLTPELQNLVREAILGNTLLKQLNTVMAEQQVGEIMKEFIAASQAAVGGRERFADSNLTFLNPFYQAIGDLISLNKGTQGRAVEVEKGRASLNLLDEVSRIVGRNIIPTLDNNNPLRQQAIEGLSIDIFDQLSSVFEEFKKLSPDQLGGLPTTILKTLGSQVGLKEEEITAQIESGNIEKLIDTIADKLATIQVGGKVDDQVLQPLRNSAIDQLLKEGNISDETATALRNGLDKNLSAETLAVTELGKHTDLLKQIRDAIDKIPGQKKSEESTTETDPNSGEAGSAKGPPRGGKNSETPEAGSQSTPEDSKSGGNGGGGGSGSGGASGSDSSGASKAPSKDSVPISPPVDPEAIKPIPFDIFKDEEDFQDFGKGYLPAYAKELNSIRKGVGGAKGSDYPLFVPNLNGDGAWINSGEKLIPNFANTGETAVLTRKMQKAMNFANGSIPQNFIDDILKTGIFQQADQVQSYIDQALQQGGTIEDAVQNAKNEAAARAKFVSDNPELSKVDKLKAIIERTSTPAGEKAAAQARLDKILQNTMPSSKSAAPVEEAFRQLNKVSNLPNVATDTMLPNINMEEAMKKIMAEEQKIAAQKAVNAKQIGGIAKNVGGSVGSQVVKQGVKRAALKAIPVLGALFGVGDAAYRIYQGDYTGAALTAAAGFTGMMPGLGSAASLGLSAALIKYDYDRAKGTPNEKISEAFGIKAADQILPGLTSAKVENENLKKSLELGSELNAIFSKNLGMGFEKPGGYLGNNFGVKIDKQPGAMAYVKNENLISPPYVGFDPKYFGNSGTDLDTIVHEAAHLNQNAMGPLGSLFGDIRNVGRGIDNFGSRDEMVKSAGSVENYRKKLEIFADQLIALGAIDPESVDVSNIIPGYENYDLRYNKNRGPGSEFTWLTKDSLKRNSIPAGAKQVADMEVFYNMERQAYLNAALANAINEGIISKDQLVSSGFARNEEEAKKIMGLISEITYYSPTPDSSAITEPYKQYAYAPTIDQATKQIVDSSLPTSGSDMILKGLEDRNDFRDPNDIVKEYIKDKEGLRFRDPEMYKIVDDAIKRQIENPNQNPSGEIDKAVKTAFNAKDPESMKQWVQSLNLNKDLWQRIADANGGWQNAIDNQDLPMNIRMGLWNRQNRGNGTSIPTSGQVLTIGYVNGSNQDPLSYRDAAEMNGADFNADGRLRNPGRDSVKELNYVRPDGTILHYRRGKLRVDKNGNNLGRGLELQSVTRPPNQEYVVEGGSEETSRIRVRNGNVDKYYKLTDVGGNPVELGGLGEYTGQVVTDEKTGVRTGYDKYGKKYGSAVTVDYSQTPEVIEAKKTGGSVEQAVRAARDRINPREERLKKQGPEEQKFLKKSWFMDDLAKEAGGLALGGNNQAEIDAQIKQKAAETGLLDRYYTDYVGVKKSEPTNVNPNQKIVGGKNNQPATQVDTKTGQGDYVPKAEPVVPVQPTPPPPPPPVQQPTVPEEIEEEEKVETNSRGYIPSFAKEMGDIRKGIGGALPTDTPLFVPNLNGKPAIVNSGEKLVPNFGGTGETAVLTREMQKMMTVAQGYIPKKAQSYSGMGMLDAIKSRHGIGGENRFANGFVPNFYEMGKTYSAREKLFESKIGDSPMFRTYSARDKLFESKIRSRNNQKQKNPRQRGSRDIGAPIPKPRRPLTDEEITQRFKNLGRAEREGPTRVLRPELGDGPIRVLRPEREGPYPIRDDGPTRSLPGTEREGPMRLPGAERKGPMRLPGAERKGPMRFPGPEQIEAPSAKDPRGFVDNAWQRIARRYYDRNLLQENIPFREFLPIYGQANGFGYGNGMGLGPESYLTTEKISKTKSNLPMAIQMALFNRAPSPFYQSDITSEIGGLGRGVPAPNYLNTTRKDGRQLSYINGRLSSVTRPQNEQYVTEGTSNDIISSRKGNVTEYYGSQGSMLGGLGSYLGRRYSDYGPAANTFIEDAKGAVLGSSQSLSYTPEVQKVKQAGGSVRDIEMATTAARDRMSPRADRLSKMDPAQRDIMTKYYFEEDLAKKLPNGINFVAPMYELTEAEAKQEILYTQGRGKRPAIIGQKSREAENMRMEYLRKSAESVGMGDRFQTEYLAAQERQILRAEQRKPIDQARASINRTDRFIQETDAYLMANQPSEQYLKDREQFIQKPVAINTPRPSSKNISTPPSLPDIPTPSSKLPISIEDEEDKIRNYSRGFIPNFAIDPTAISAAKLREKREAGSDSIPTFTMYNNKPMVYDARTQTPASAIKDHSSEGGYEGVVKRQFGSNASNNIVANMAYKMPKDAMNKSGSNSSSGPVFNINFSPQTTYSSQRNSDVPNFANITKKYDTMIADMRTSLKTVWDKYSSLDNITKSNIRDGKLNSGTPRTKRSLQSINII